MSWVEERPNDLSFQFVGIPQKIYRKTYGLLSYVDVHAGSRAS